MFRITFAILAGLSLAGPAAAATWADAMFDELSKDFGSVPRGPTLTHPFRLTNNTGQPVHIAGVRVSCGCVSAGAANSTLAPGQSTAIVAHMDTRRFAGIKTVTIYVQLDRPNWEEVRLWVQANCRDDVSVSPDSLAFGPVRRASAPSASVTVTLLGSDDWKITAVASDSNYVRPKLKELKREGSEVAYELTATLRSDTPVGKWYTDLWLKTNNPSMPRVRVPLTVEIESALTVTPSAVLLGQVPMGQQVERKVIVRGVKPFKVTGVEGTDGQLTVQDSTADSKPVHVLTVKLNATRAGDYSRTVRVVTDLKEEGDIEFVTQASIVP